MCFKESMSYFLASLLQTVEIWVFTVCQNIQDEKGLKIFGK